MTVSRLEVKEVLVRGAAVVSGAAVMPRLQCQQKGRLYGPAIDVQQCSPKLARILASTNVRYFQQTVHTPSGYPI